MFGSRAFGGAQIENISKKIEEMEDTFCKVDSHIVVMVGTNNLRSDGSIGVPFKWRASAH